MATVVEMKNFATGRRVMIYQGFSLFNYCLAAKEVVSLHYFTALECIKLYGNIFKY